MYQIFDFCVPHTHATHTHTVNFYPNLTIVTAATAGKDLLFVCVCVCVCVCWASFALWIAERDENGFYWQNNFFSHWFAFFSLHLIP